MAENPHDDDREAQEFTRAVFGRPDPEPRTDNDRDNTAGEVTKFLQGLFNIDRKA